MAIQSVSFMGREGCIKPAEKAEKFFNGRTPIENVKKVEEKLQESVDKAEKFFNGRTPIENVKKVEEKLQESVDKAALKSYKESHTNIETSAPSADKIAEAYRAAHGIQ